MRHPTQIQFDSRLSHSKYACWLMLAFVMLPLGCAHIGPETIMEQRLPYHEAVTETWKEQALLNIVKMRYSDTITFSEVAQIIDSHGREQSGGFEFGLIPGLFPGVDSVDRLRGLLQGSARHSDRPTITYTPQTGSDFLQKLARPLAPEVILFFLESDYPADLVMKLTLESINGVRNRSSSGTVARPADPEFEWLVQVFRRAQESRSVALQVKIDEEQNQTSVLRIRPPNAPADPQLEEELFHVRELLGLDQNINEYRVESGNIQFSSDEIVMQTRPLLRVLASLSQYVEVPEKHLCDGSASPADLSNESEPVLTVHSSIERPECFYTAACYRGHWYWIDDRDIKSKITITYLLLLLAEADRQDRTAVLPLVTIPAN